MTGATENSPYSNDWFRVRITPKPHEHFVVTPPFDAVTVAVRDESGRWLLVRQHRPALGVDTWELPAGGLEKDETPVEAARRETQEETGLTLNNPVLVTSFQSSVGLTDQVFHVVSGQARSTEAPVWSEEKLEHAWITNDALLKEIRVGRIATSHTVIPVMLANLPADHRNDLEPN